VPQTKPTTFGFRRLRAPRRRAEFLSDCVTTAYISRVIGSAPI